MQVYFHYPGQLMKSFIKPGYNSSLIQFLTSLYTNEHNDPNGVLEFALFQPKTLRKRANSNTPCNPDIESYDKHIQYQLINELGCIPIYWKNMFDNETHYKDCTKPGELKSAYRKLSDVQKMLRNYEKPCDEMIVTVNSFANKNPTTYLEETTLAFYYKEQMYEEIQYIKAMGFESWLSNVGGFVGIFLGYSMMQIPELVIWMFNMFHQRKYKYLKGK